MSRRGLLLTMTEPPPAMEEEFNAWYDDEHMGERLAVIGLRPRLDLALLSDRAALHAARKLFRSV